MGAILKVWRHIKNLTCQLMRIYLMNNAAKFHPDPILNDRTLGFRRVCPNNKNNNKTCKDIRSVRGPKKYLLKCDFKLIIIRTLSQVKNTKTVNQDPSIGLIQRSKSVLWVQRRLSWVQTRLRRGQWTPCWGSQECPSRLGMNDWSCSGSKTVSHTNIHILYSARWRKQRIGNPTIGVL